MQENDDSMDCDGLDSGPVFGWENSDTQDDVSQPVSGSFLSQSKHKGGPHQLTNLKRRQLVPLPMPVFGELLKYFNIRLNNKCQSIARRYLQ